MKEIRLQPNHEFSNIELQHWPKLFDSPACKVTLAADGNYYLSACRFEKLTDPTEVFKSEKKLKTMMHAIFKIEKPDFENLVPVDKENAPSGYRERVGDTLNACVNLVSPSGVGRATPVIVTIIDKYHNGTPEARQERWYDYFLDQCNDWIDNTVVFEALDYFAKKTVSLTLRQTYEVVKRDEGGKYRLLRNKWVEKKDLSVFTESLDRFDMEGHGVHVERLNYDYSRPIMSLSAAQTFLAGLLKQWLEKKRQTYKLAAAQVQAKYLSNKTNT
jgi:hypothetical protein